LIGQVALVKNTLVQMGLWLYHSTCHFVPYQA